MNDLDTTKQTAQARGYTVVDDFGGWRLLKDGECCGLMEFKTEAEAWEAAARLISPKD